MAVIFIAIALLFIIRAQMNKKVLSVFIGIALFVISIGKDIMSNGDLMSYQNGYYLKQFSTFGDLWNGYLLGDIKDFGYQALAKTFSTLGLPVEVWFGFIALVFAVCVAVALYRSSADPFIAVIILFTFYFAFTLSGLRQTVAMGLIIWSYQYIKERRLAPYLALFVVAFFFHASAIIFFPAYWLWNLRVGYKQLFAVAGALAICVFAPGLLRLVIARVAWTDYMMTYATRDVSLSWAGYIIQFGMLLFCYALRKSIPAEKAQSCVDPYINFMVVGLCLIGASTIVAEMFRLSYYYLMASMFAIPNIIMNMERRNAKIAYTCVCGALLLYLTYGNFYASFNLFGG